MIPISNLSDRLTHLINVRALAILIVVLGHSIILYSPSWGVYETSQSVPLLASLKAMINMVQMPLFFSLSGYLFVLTHEKHRGMIALLKSKSKRLLIPYLAVSLCYLFPIRFLLDYPGSRSETLVEIIKSLLTIENVGHLWFLPVLFLVFVLAELLLVIGKHLPWFSSHPDMTLYLGTVFLYFEGYRIYFGYMPLRMAYIYLLWFTLGYAVNRFYSFVRHCCRMPFVTVLLVLAEVVLVFASLRLGMGGLPVTLGIPALFILLLYGLAPDQCPAPVRVLGLNSFGLYLLHSPLIYITFTLIPNASPIWVVFINFVIFGFSACLLTSLIRKTKLRFMIGE